MVPRGRDKMTVSKVLGMGRLTREQLDKAISHKLSSDNILCTDSWRAFNTAEKKMDNQFKSDGRIRTKGLYHIQYVNNYPCLVSGIRKQEMKLL